MKQREAAQAVGVDIPMYSRYEHGERRPKREQVVRLARLFGADSDELVALWLAFSAMNAIGHDRLSGLALSYLREELGDEPQPVVSQVVEQPREEPVPAVKVERGLVAELGDTLFPKFVQGELLEVLGQIEDASIDCVLTSQPLDRAIRTDADLMREVKRVLKAGGSIMLSKAGHELNENMCRRFLESACSDQGIVLDLCCGSATVCKTAFDMKLRSIGISSDDETLRQAHRLVQQTPLSLF